MKRFFAAFFCTLVLLVGMTSCNWIHSDAPESVDFDSLVIDSVCPLFRNYAKPACHISIKLDKPSDRNASADDIRSLESALVALPRDGSLAAESGGSLKVMANNYVREFIFQYLLDGKEAIDSYHGDIEAAANWLNYEEVLEGKVLFNLYGLISYQFSIYSYSGGAHGNTVVRTCAYDRKQGRSFFLNDLFADDSQSRLSAMIQQRLLEQYECASAEELAAKGFFDLSSVSATESFVFNYDGMTFIYDPYEIATYSCGVIEVFLPWRDLKPLVRLDSPLAEMAEMYGI